MSESRASGLIAVRALSLFGVFAFAKLAVVAGRSIPWSPWLPVALLWQDAAVTLAVGAIDFALGRKRVGWTLYAMAVLYVAINVAVVRVLFSPLTLPMLRAARGTLRDSIAHYFTLTNFTLILAILAVGVLLPRLLRSVSRLIQRLAFAGGIALVALGPVATSRVETAGLHRNAFVTLINSALPHVRAQSATRDWRRSPFQQERRENLARLRGAAAGRNVLMILLESTGARYLKAYGAAEDPTPNLTALASTGLFFESAYCVYPESIKGLFSVLCSRYPAFDTNAQIYAKISTPSIAQLLSQMGYRTGLFHSGRFMYLGMESIINDRGFDVLEDASAISGNSKSSFGVDEVATVERMLGWIDALPAGERFFVTYLPIAGHHPYSTPAPRPFPDTPEVNAYRSALHLGDAALGKLIAGLKARGLIKTTLFVIFGDHGEAFGQHEGNTGHTLFIYEENVRVPFFVVLPGKIDASIRISRVASLIDAAPTILDLLGTTAPASWQGTSLLEDREQMALFYTDYSLGLLGLRDGAWKLILELGSPRPKLFDLTRDPNEELNLSDQYPERVRIYGEHLRAWSAAQKEKILRD